MTALNALSSKPLPVSLDAEGLWRVSGTRVRIETIITAFTAGANAEEILSKFPSLQLPDIYAVITYYFWHQSEIDEYVAERHRAIAEAEREVESRFPSAGIRERLLARRGAKP